MRVLVACEYSATVRDAFIQAGHDAYSCDLLPCEKGPERHYQCDVFEVIGMGWDLMIAHPPCTYLSVSGMHWTTRGLRDPQLTEDALKFVKKLLDAPIEKIALENPVSVISSKIRKPDQIVHPWMFGENASKKTCLWLKGLPKLEVYYQKVIPPFGWSRVMSAADMLECDLCGEPYCPECSEHYASCNCIGPSEDDVHYKEMDGFLFARRGDFIKPVWGNQTKSGQNKLAPGPDRWKKRSRTYQGIADAMASQWGKEQKAEAA